MKKNLKFLKRIINESIEEIINQEYRTKKPVEPKEEGPEWMKGIELSMDDIKEKFAGEEEYNDNTAGGKYEINPSNPIFYVNGREMPAQSITPFHNDFATVKCNGQEGFIDKDGELLGSKFYRKCDDFEDGWGLVINDENKRNYVNKDGKYLLPTWVSRASSFMGGQAIVINNGERYTIDTQGNRME